MTHLSIVSFWHFCSASWHLCWRAAYSSPLSSGTIMALVKAHTASSLCASGCRVRGVSMLAQVSVRERGGSGVGPVGVATCTWKCNAQEFTQHTPVSRRTFLSWVSGTFALIAGTVALSADTPLLAAWSECFQAALIHARTSVLTAWSARPHVSRILQQSTAGHSSGGEMYGVTDWHGARLHSEGRLGPGALLFSS